MTYDRRVSIRNQRVRSRKVCLAIGDKIPRGFMDLRKY